MIVTNSSQNLTPQPAAFDFAVWCASHLPRGNARIPRWIGRTFLRGQQLAITTASGARLAVDTSNLDLYTNMVLQGFTWDQKVLNTCLRFLRPGSVFFDVGGNAGYFAVEVATQFPKVKVFSFEPQPNLARHIRASAALNDAENIMVVEACLGEEERQGALNLALNAGHASLHDPEGGPRGRLQCDIRTIDQECGRGNLPLPDVIKVDVEGGELDVFRGAEKTLRERAPVLVFEALQRSRSGVRRRELCQYLQAVAGYRLAFVTDEGPLAAANLDDSRFTDMVAVPPQMHDVAAM